MLATINGLDLVLLIGGLIGWFLYIVERRAFTDYLDADDVEGSSAVWE